MTDDIFTARDRLVQATMADLDNTAESNDALLAGDVALAKQIALSKKAFDLGAELRDAKLALWQLTRGRKWPA